MRGYLAQVLLLIAVVTALVQPHDGHGVAAVKDSWGINSSQSQMNITHGCFGLHCLAADNVEANYFVDPGQLSGMLYVVTNNGKNPSQPDAPAVECPQGERYIGTTCIPGGPKPPCKNDIKNRAPIYCQ